MTSQKNEKISKAPPAVKTQSHEEAVDRSVFCRSSGRGFFLGWSGVAEGNESFILSLGDAGASRSSRKESLGDLGERLAGFGEAVEIVLPLASRRDDAAVAQEREVMAHRGLALAELVQERRRAARLRKESRRPEDGFGR